eukprot:4454854-Heterocapsa_arctica.AAC.1
MEQSGDGATCSIGLQPLSMVGRFWSMRPGLSLASWPVSSGPLDFRRGVGVSSGSCASTALGARGATTLTG